MDVAHHVKDTHSNLCCVHVQCQKTCSEEVCTISMLFMESVLIHSWLAVVCRCASELWRLMQGCKILIALHCLFPFLYCQSSITPFSSYWKKETYRKVFLPQRSLTGNKQDLVCKSGGLSWAGGFKGKAVPQSCILEYHHGIVQKTHSITFSASRSHQVTRHLLKLFPSMLQHHRKHSRAIR